MRRAAPQPPAARLSVSRLAYLSRRSLVLAVALTCVFGVGSAQAATKTVAGVVGAFTEQSGSGEGEFSANGQSVAVAVNQATGDVYVLDAGNDRVQRFDADGNFVSQWGVCGSAEGEFAFCFGGDMSASLDVDETDGSVYVADPGNQRIQKFTADGAFVHTFGFAVQQPADPDNPPPPAFEVCTAGCQGGAGGFEEGQFDTPIAVAVEADGDVLVADHFNGRIQRFDSSGAYQSQFSTGFMPKRVAVDSTGAIYVLNLGSEVHKFDSTGASAEVFAPEEIDNPADLATAGDRVLVAQGIPVNPDDPEDPARDQLVLEFDPALASGDQLVETHYVAANLGFNTTTSGLAAHAGSGRVYIAVFIEGNNNFSRVFILDEGGAPPATATPVPASDVGTTTATLSGEINSNGPLPTDYRIEITFDGLNWRTVDSGTVPGDATETVSTNATALRANTLYRFRIVTNKGFGNPDINSPELIFHTNALPPTILDARAGTVDTTSATLLGSINPHGSPTRYRFDYGIGAFNRSIPIPQAQIGSGHDPVFVTQTIQGLAPNTTYQFRLVATNTTAPPTVSATKTFTTINVPPERRRGYELVSPADKPGGVGVGPWYGGPATTGTVGVGAYDRERFAVQGSLGSVIVEGPIAYGADWAFAERTPGGWINKPVLSRRAHGSQLLTIPELRESTEDLSLTAFSANAHLLRLFPEMEDWDESITGAALLIRDWTSDWELVAPTDFSQARPFDSQRPPGDAAKAFADDGSALVASAKSLRGLEGPLDPTIPIPDDPTIPGDSTIPAERLVDARSVYLDEIERPFTGIFPGDDGVRELVDVCTGEGPTRTILPDGPCPPAQNGRDEHLISPGGGGLTIAENEAPSPRVISSDGSRVFFMSPDPALPTPPSAPQVYVRQRNSDNACDEPPCVVTRWISRPQPGASSGPLGAAYFESASRDGDKVLFRTTTPLTADDPNSGSSAGASQESSDLYMYDLPAGNEPAGGQLTRITGGPTGDSDCNSPEELTRQGAVRYASDDASRVYFVCAGPLNGPIASVGGSITAHGGTAAATDASNLYLYDASRPAAQRWRFIARLPRGGVLQSCATTAIGAESVLVAGAANLTTGISQQGNCFSGTGDGSLVTFFTDGRLTADDPDAVTGDIYGYDATRDELLRVSAPQGGPGGTYDCAPGSTDSPQCYGDGGISESEMTRLKRLGVAVRPDGTRLAFFQSRSRLLPGDVDDAYDVYQWSEGELSLISTGQSDTDGAFYVGNDRSGLNVYIATRDRLTWQDHDAVLDVYTARIGGGITEPSTPGVCVVLADACQAGGGAGLVSGQPRTSSPVSDRNAASRRRTLSLSGLGSRARRRAVRTGRLVVSVRASDGGVVRLRATARIGGRPVRVAGTRRRVKAGVTRIGLRLSARARRVLSKGRALRVTVRVAQTGARTRSATAILEGGKRS